MSRSYHHKILDVVAVNSAAIEDEQVVVASGEDSYIAYQDRTFQLDCHVEADMDNPAGILVERFGVYFVWVSQRAFDVFDHPEWVVSVTRCYSTATNNILLACIVAARVQYR